MSNLVLKDINKIYPNGFHAVHNFNLEIKDGEFIVFVGPSGCGKSTTLRMIAGLEEISKGDFLINGVRANEKSPVDRGIAMVFQSYALYPHLTVLKDLERPSSTRLEARFRYYDLRVKTRSPSPFAWRPDFLAAPREAH